MTDETTTPNEQPETTEEVTDQPTPDVTATDEMPQAPVIEVVSNNDPLPRVFHVSGKKVVEPEGWRGKPLAECQAKLAATYPEIENSTFSAKIEDGLEHINFIPKPGRKG